MVIKRASKKKEKEKVKDKQEEVAEKTVIKDIIEKNDHGTIKIHEDVIGDVVREALNSMKDLVNLEGGLMDSIAGLMGSSKGAIAIEMMENSVNVAVKVNIIYGQNVSTIATKIQKTIKDAINNITSMKVDQVDVFVQKLVRPPEVKKVEEEE